MQSLEIKWDLLSIWCSTTGQYVPTVWSLFGVLCFVSFTILYISKSAVLLYFLFYIFWHTLILNYCQQFASV